MVVLASERGGACLARRHDSEGLLAKQEERAGLYDVAIFHLEVRAVRTLQVLDEDASTFTVDACM